MNNTVRLLLCGALLAALLFAAGCGQKGPLVLPTRTDSKQPAEPPPEAPDTLEPVIDGRGTTQPR